MRACPDCGRQFSSDGSYRVHKFRFHREFELPVATQEAAPTASETAQLAEPTPEPVSEKPEGENNTGSNDGLAWLAGGAVVVVAILALLFGKK